MASLQVPVAASADRGRDPAADHQGQVETQLCRLPGRAGTDGARGGPATSVPR